MAATYMKLTIAVYFVLTLAALAQPPAHRPRAAELGIPSGTLPRGPLDAITDVAGLSLLCASSALSVTLR